MTRPRRAVVLAAGMGTRMKSQTPKVLHQVLGRPMICWVVEKALNAGCDQVAVVVGHAKEEVISAVRGELDDPRVSFYEQTQMLGTGDAVRAASPAFEGWAGDVLILCGDVPNVPEALVAAMLDAAAEGQSPLTFATAIAPPGTAYGRVVRAKADGAVQAIVEFKDADDAQRMIREINTGNYAVDAAFLAEGLAGLDTNNAQGEFYLTDLIAMAAERGTPANAIVADEIAPLDGVNNREHLARANGVALELRRGELLRSGVTMLIPETVWLDAVTQIAPDATIEANVSLFGRTVVGAGATIEAGCRLERCTVAPGVRVLGGTIASDETFA